MRNGPPRVREISFVESILFKINRNNYIFIIWFKIEYLHFKYTKIFAKYMCVQLFYFITISLAHIGIFHSKYHPNFDYNYVLF